MRPPSRSVLQRLAGPPAIPLEKPASSGSAWAHRRDDHVQQGHASQNRWNPTRFDDCRYDWWRTGATEHIPRTRTHTIVADPSGINTGTITLPLMACLSVALNLDGAATTGTYTITINPQT